MERGLITAKSCLLGWAYYPSGSTVAQAGGTFLPTDHPGMASAWQGSPTTPQQLEVAMLARAYVGKNKLGKPVYLRHFIHDVFNAGSDQNAHAAITNPGNVLAKWNSGAGPHSVVPVDPTGGAAGSGWEFENHLYTRQLRRGHKKPAAKSGSGTSPLDQLTAAELAALKALGDLAVSNIGP